MFTLSKDESIDSMICSYIVSYTELHLASLISVVCTTLCQFSVRARTYTYLFNVGVFYIKKLVTSSHFCICMLPISYQTCVQTMMQWGWVGYHVYLCSIHAWWCQKVLAGSGETSFTLTCT